MGRTSRLRAAAFAALASLTVFTAAAMAPPPTAAAGTLADRVIADAMSHLNAPYVWGTSGPRTFDCSGLVYPVFADNGLGAMIGYSHSARTQYAILRSRGLASRTGGQRGDLVVYNNGAHVGIYLGNGRVISALVNGVKIHALNALTIPFTAFLHTGLDGKVLSLSARSASTSATSRRTRVATNIRTAASTAARRISVLPAGTLVRVLRSTHDGHGRTWYRVRTTHNWVGWVAAWLIR